MSLFDKFMLARQLRFTDGKIELFDEPLVFTPSDFLAMYISNLNENYDLIKGLYTSAKVAVREGFGIDVGKAYGFSFRNYSDWFVDILKLSGWGNVSWEVNDPDNHEGVIVIEGSPIATYLKGKVNLPCDHIMRGFLAGGASSAYKLDIDVLETECEAIGSEKCRFIIDTKDVLMTKFPDFSRQQLG